MFAIPGPIAQAQHPLDGKERRAVSTWGRFIALVGAAFGWALLFAPTGVCAQTSNSPSRMPPGPVAKPGPLGAMSSPERFLVTSSANDRGTFLWVIDAVEHTVTLCEKAAATAAEFTCNKKPLP
jgi:hypothetical protein